MQPKVPQHGNPLPPEKRAHGQTSALAFFGVIAALLLTVATVVGGIFLTKRTPEHPSTALRPQRVAAPRPIPSLHCLFSDYLHERVVVGFDFAVTFSKGSPPHFLERAMAVGNDPEIDFAVGSQPDWRYAVDDGTPTITSPDGETRILLYGLKLGTSDVLWAEAGLRSNEFRNLDGKCLQAHLEKPP